MNRFCKCGRVCQGRACQRCQPKSTDSMTYKTTKQRGYGDDWRQLSERYRRHQPLCEDCLKDDLVTPASEVHHVVPISVDPTLRLVWSNLVALCSTCHNLRHE